MRRLLFSVCAVLAVLGCGGENVDDLPPIGGGDDYGYYEYGYCGYGNNWCEYMNVNECYNYGGSNYGSDSDCGVSYSSYGYCGYGNNNCSYMSVSDCYNYYGGSDYGGDSNCGVIYYEYGYCGYYSSYYRCEYMSVNDCYNYYGGSYYGSDNSCGGYNYPSSSSYAPVLEPSSSSRSSSSSTSFFASSSSSSVRSSSSSAPSSSSSVRISSSSSVRIDKGNNISNYRTAVIGSQTWMAENLDYAPSSGTFISCDSYDCATYGRLYDWSTAMALPSTCNDEYCSSQIQSPHRGICPNGWHIPSNDDWAILENYVGGSSTAGRYLKATSGWYDNGNGTDSYGFSALPGGITCMEDGSFGCAGSNGYWWSASESGSYDAYFRYMDYSLENAIWNILSKSYLFSVRCLQD